MNLGVEARRAASPSGEDEPHPSWRWHQFDLDQPSTRALVAAPALVRAKESDDNSLVLVLNLQRWVERNREQLLVDAPPGQCHILWAQPGQRRLDDLYRESRGALSALRIARPTQLQAVGDAPETWGLYRIHQERGVSYTGISSNLRSRLYAHETSGGLDYQRGDKVEILLAKQPGTHGIVTWADLQEAERHHISRLKQRGVEPINVVAGGNGMPPHGRFNPGGASPSSGQAAAAPAMFPFLDWHTATVWAVGRRAETEHKARAMYLYTRYSLPRGEFDLQLALDPDLRVWAIPGRTGEATQVGESRISCSLLRSLYAQRNYGADLDQALAAVDPELLLPDELKLCFWEPIVEGVKDDGEPAIPAQALHGISAADVFSRRLPRGIADQGLEVDPGFEKPGHLNPVIRVRSANGSQIYLKVESNAAAARAEVLSSLIWYRLRWAGIGDRVTLSADQTTLIVPPVGGQAGIGDMGDFGVAFADCPMESPESLRAERARVVRRVGLARLRLEDPDDVIRFVALNGAWGNTDRHLNNVHYGWRSDPDAEGGGVGYLLPLDHGRCFFNNQPRLGDKAVHGSPAAAVTGKIGNPHQLLRAFVERAADSPERARQVIERLCRDVVSILSEITVDDEWRNYVAEIEQLQARLTALREDPDAFIAACQKAVLT